MEAHSLDEVVPEAGAVGTREQLAVLVQRLGQSRFGPYLGLLIVLIALIVYVSLTEDAFLSQANITNILRTSAIPLVLAGGMTLVLFTAGVDLSVGATLALCGVFYAQMSVDRDIPGVLALLLTLVVGAGLGLFNGFLIGKVQMSFFVVTLGTLSLYRGIAFLWRDESVDMFTKELPAFLGNDALFGDTVPIGFLVAIGLYLFLAVVLRYTSFGRSVYAVGGNREAAELSGIRAGRVVALVYVISGMCAALGSVMLIGRTTISVATAGTGIELNVAAAVLLGGAALSGGVGSIWGTLLGVMFLQVLSNALDLAGVSGFWQQIVTGAILITAIYLDSVRSRRIGS
jgi:ribose/xylose/arabinose/galactoside ABC-type transport system permease subunit